MNKQLDYSKYFSSSELLANSVLEKYKNETGKIDFPVNPFKILKSLNVKLLIRNFKELEGLFIPATSIEDIDIWKISKLQRLLYKYTPFGNQIIFPRQSNNRISGAEVSTVDYKLVTEELIKVGESIDELVNRKDNMTLHKYILETLKIHHKLTIIHPLEDGNGRCCRAMLLWLLRLKNIPPIYIKLEDKSRYIDALNRIDTKGDYDYLELLILEKIISSMVLFDEKLEL